MVTDNVALLRDAVVLTYMLFLRIGVPLLVIVFAGKWIQRRMAETDLREQRARRGEPYCWDLRRNAQTTNAKNAALAYPELPCWLAVQSAGGGVTESCFNCPRYAVQPGHSAGDTVEVD
jgi:hypothetical protein